MVGRISRPGRVAPIARFRPMPARWRRGREAACRLDRAARAAVSPGRGEPSRDEPQPAVRMVTATSASIEAPGAARRPALGRREGLFRQVVEAAPNAMVMIDAAGRIEMVNSQAELVFGYGVTELLGQRVEMLVPDRFRRHHQRLRAAFLADPCARPMGAGRDLYALRKDGSEFPVEIGLNPIDTEDGPMVLAAIVDISERKRLAEIPRYSRFS